MKQYHVYIMSNHYDTAFYVGMTNDLERRLWEHRSGLGSRFTSRYRIKKLLLVETFGEVEDAIRREKQLKGWTRAKKLTLIRATSPDLDDLAPSP